MRQNARSFRILCKKFVVFADKFHLSARVHKNPHRICGGGSISYQSIMICYVMISLTD